MVKVFIRYLHYDVLNYRYRQVDECRCDTIEAFKYNLLRYPGLAGAVGYGKRIREDLKAWIVLQITDSHGERNLEFETAKDFIEYVRRNKEVARALRY